MVIQDLLHEEFTVANTANYLISIEIVENWNSLCKWQVHAGSSNPIYGEHNHSIPLSPAGRTSVVWKETYEQRAMITKL